MLRSSICLMAARTELVSSDSKVTRWLRRQLVRIPRCSHWRTARILANPVADTFTGYLYGQRPLGITFAKRNPQSRAEGQEDSGEMMGGMDHQIPQDQMMEPTGITQDQIM